MVAIGLAPVSQTAPMWEGLARSSMARMSVPLEPIDVDLSNKRVIDTGATSGIGKETAWGAIVRVAFTTQRTPDMGADTLVGLVASPELEGKTGGYYKDRRAIDCRWRSDVPAQGALWQLCQEQSAGR